MMETLYLEGVSHGATDVKGQCQIKVKGQCHHLRSNTWVKAKDHQILTDGNFIFYMYVNLKETHMFIDDMSRSSFKVKGKYTDQS